MCIYIIYFYIATTLCRYTYTSKMACVAVSMAINLLVLFCCCFQAVVIQRMLPRCWTILRWWRPWPWLRALKHKTKPLDPLSSRLSNGKTGPWLFRFRGLVGNEILPSCVGIVLNHKDPYERISIAEGDRFLHDFLTENCAWRLNSLIQAFQKF